MVADNTRQNRTKPMADQAVPHFQNDQGVEAIRIGAREFMCIGATPPYDHPHVFLDMGGDDSVVCPYCSTLFQHDSSLKPVESNPTGCSWTLDAGDKTPLEAAE
jgi:uncharacterized Zn-finger protein